MATKTHSKNSTTRTQTATNSRVGSKGTKLQGQKTVIKKKHKSLEDLLEDGLNDVYSAEIQLIEALPEMEKAAFSEDLQDIFAKHLNETKRHAERLEKIFARLEIKRSLTKNCEAVELLIESSQLIIEEYEENAVRDSALIIAAQKIEHYEMAAYASLCELCDVLGYNQIGSMLERTFDEEKKINKNLSQIAQDVNDDAYEMSQNERSSHDNEY